MSELRFLPLTAEGKPLLPYRSQPELGMSDGIEYGPWVKQAVERGYGVGTVLESSGLVVVDCDSEIEFGRASMEKKGIAVFKAMFKEKGFEIEPTFTVSTRTPGHYHLYYRQHPEYRITRTSIRSLIDCVDIKTTGYVVSWFTTGYSIARKFPVIEFPEWLAKELSERQSEKGEPPQAGERIMTDDHKSYLLDELARAQKGSRNAFLHAAARTFAYAERISNDDYEALYTAATCCGLDADEVARTIESAWKGFGYVGG